MSPAWIRPRRNSDGSKSYQVLYRRGGRGAPIETAGSFRGWPSGRRNGQPAAALTTAEQDARSRRDLVAGWLAQGLDPRVELAKLNAPPPPPPRSFRQTGDAMILTRHDAAESTLNGYRKALDKVDELRPDLAAKPPADWTVGDMQELVAAMVADGLSPGTIDVYIGKTKLVFEHADVTPNPARDKRVRIPSQVKAEEQPPTDREVLTILGRVSPKMALAVVALEQTAMRIGELASLTWADVDVAGSRFRLSRERVKTRHPRWVQVPGWLMTVIADRTPPEDRVAGRRVFGVSEDGVRGAMYTACQVAGIPLYSPHDLRHRRASLWHGQGVSTRELMARGGWSKSELPVDTYTHVMPLDELDVTALEELLAR